ncbi:hypothetical protein F3Y22_tig00113725pilonHSYRG00396 [Hibiscus syriacus]|uniref:Uncharacterized protein n=1 Tax=Hibiscus syriacus TaxID=106335 RepID=A0A6A2Y1A5_HIBSY|nr:hypothetical protein F3Y22_tig00113725pilonHSYRG00396 [Hibiscus syriacus]
MQRKFNFTTKGPLVVNKQFPNFRANFNFTAKDIGLQTTQVQLHDEGTAGCQQTTSQFQSQFQLHSEGYWTPDNASSTSRRRDRWLSTNNFSISEPISTSQRRILDSRQRKFNFTTKGPLVVNKQLLNFRANFNFTAKDIGLQTTQVQLHDEGTAGSQQTTSQFQSQFQLHNERYWTPDNASSTSRRRDRWLLKNNFPISEPISTSQRKILDSRQRKFNFTTKGPLVVNKQFPNFGANFNFTAKDIGLQTTQVQLHDEGTAGCQQTTSQFQSQFQLHNERYWTPDNPKPISTSQRMILDSRQCKFNFTTKGPLVVNKQLPNFRANFNFTAKDIGLETTQVQLQNEGTAGCQQTISQFRSQFQLHSEGYWTRDNTSSTSQRRDDWLSTNNFPITEPISTSRRRILDSEQSYLLEFQLHDEGYPIPGSTSRRRGHLRFQLHDEGNRAHKHHPSLDWISTSRRRISNSKKDYLSTKTFEFDYAQLQGTSFTV